MALPDWVKPQFTKLLDQRPDGPEWLHESKFDGYLVFSDHVKGLTCRLLPFCYKTVGNASAAEVAGAQLDRISGGRSCCGCSQFRCIDARQ